MERAAKGALRVPALLGAAYAAEAADEVSERDKYLRLLAQTSTRLSGLVLLVRVTFEIKRGEWERASATLRAIKESGMSGPEVQRQALLVACRLHDFEAIVSQLTALARSGVLPESEIRSYAIRAVSDKLSRPPTDAKQLWDSMPRNWKNWEEMRQIVAKEFARQGRSLDALGLLRQNLRARYSGEDVEALARLADIAPEERAKELAQLRNRHGSRPELLRESGRIAIELGLWGQAKSFLESAGTPAEDPELARLLGRIAENESRIKAALADYRLGLDSAIGKPADITDTRD